MPDDVARQLRRRWERAEFLTAFAHATPWAPLSLSIRGPSAADLASDFGAVQDWLRVWHSSCPAPIRVEHRRVGGRTIGANSVPGRAWIGTYTDLWMLLDVAAEVEWFVNALGVARERMPRVADWMLKRSMQALAHQHVWHQLTDTVSWIAIPNRSSFARLMCPTSTPSSSRCTA